MKRAAAVLAALAALVVPAGATSEAPAEALAAAGARIEGAVEALETPGEGRIGALAEAMAAYESALAGLRDSVIGAEERERELAFELQLRRDETTRLLAALQATSRAPAQARALHPEGPLGAARAASMLAALAPKLRSEADALKARLAEIEAARALRARGVEGVSAGLVALAAARAALVAALARSAAPPDATAAPTAAALREADTLSALADGLARSGGDAAPPAAGSQTPMALRWPVAGRPLRGFREADAAGVRRPGLLVQAPPLALIVAPAAARVRYAGPFLDYGYVVVLEPRADVLVVLAGLATLEARTGAAVDEGELLGLLGGRQLETQEYLMLGEAGTGETPGETLYIELRHGEGPVDPAPWFAKRNG